MSSKQIINLIVRFVITLIVIAFPALFPDSILYEGERVKNTLTITGNFIGFLYLLILILCVDNVIGKQVANKLFPIK